jgi:hypothetical protein
MGNSKTVRNVFSAVVLTIAILLLLLLVTHNYVFGQTTPTALDPSQGWRQHCWLVENDELWLRYGAAPAGRGWWLNSICCGKRSAWRTFLPLCWKEGNEWRNRLRC